MTGRWVKKPRWGVSHYLPDAEDRPQYFGIDVGRVVCGYSVTINDRLEDEPTGVDTTDRCVRCERVVGR